MWISRKTDLDGAPACAGVLRECEQALRAVADPEAASALCLRDQPRRIEEVGGIEAVRRRGMFRFSPPPGADPVMFK